MIDRKGKGSKEKMIRDGQGQTEEEVRAKVNYCRVEEKEGGEVHLQPHCIKTFCPIEAQLHVAITTEHT